MPFSSRPLMDFHEVRLGHFRTKVALWVRQQNVARKSPSEG
jgi:hypothetical protein